MSIIFLSFFTGILLRMADGDPDDTQSLLIRLRHAATRYAIWLIFVGLFVLAGLYCFAYASITGPWFRFGSFVWHGLGQVPVFLFGTVIAYLTTDFILRHRNSEKALIPGIMLGMGALAMIVAVVFPADQLTSVLSSLETPVAKLNFATTPQSQRAEKPGLLSDGKHSGIDTNGADNAKRASQTIATVTDRLSGLKALALHLSGSNDAAEHPAETATYAVFEHIVDPLGSCAYAIRSVTDNEHRDLLIGEAFALKLQHAIALSFVEPSNRNPGEEYNISFNELRTETTRISKQFDLHHKIGRIDTSSKGYLYAKCEYLSHFPFDKNVREYFDKLFDGNSFPRNLYISSHRLPHFSILESSILSLQNQRRTSVEELRTWIVESEKYTTENERDPKIEDINPEDKAKRYRSVLSALNAIYAANIMAAYNDFKENPKIDLFAEKLVFRKFEDLIRSNPMMADVYTGSKSHGEPYFTTDGMCRGQASIEGYHDGSNLEYYKDYLVRLYAININNYVYYSTLYPEIFLKEELDVIERQYIPILRSVDLDCASLRRKGIAQVMALYFADSYVNYELASLQRIFDSETAFKDASKRVACELAPLRDHIASILDDLRRDVATDILHGNDDGDLGKAMEQEFADRDTAELISTGDQIIRHIEALTIASAGSKADATKDGPLSFRRAYSKLCS